MTDPAEQLVEWVDQDGRVLEVVARARVRAENLLHRAVAVVVRSSAGDVLVHRRADWKDVWPGFWDLTVGGVVGVGEDWERAARRELHEEIGIERHELRALGGYYYADADVAALCQVFTTVADGPLSLLDGEVVEVAWVPRSALGQWVAGRAVCPDGVHGVLPLL